jgi:hypothetical protein
VTTIEEKKAARARLLKLLYDLSDGQFRPQGVFDMGDTLGISYDDAADAADYLEHEGLIAVHGVVGRDAAVTLSHKGTREIEAALSEPQRSTQHLAPLINIQQFHAPVTNSQIAQGSPSAHQSASWVMDQSEITDLITKLRSALDDLPTVDADERSYIEQQLATAEQHAGRSDDRGRRIVQEALASVRRYLEGMAVSASWYGLTLLPLLPRHG